jgi:hypothetical protein
MPRLLNDFMATAREMGYSPDDISLNEIQMTILAEADIHISVQGGPAYMSMLWGRDKTALLVQRKSPELPNEAHTWFDLISGMSVETTYTDRDLISRVRDVYHAPLRAPAERAALEAQFHGVRTPGQRRLMVATREKCVKKDTSSGGGQSRYEFCAFRSAAQVVYSSEEVYMLGFWEADGARRDAAGAPAAPDGAWMDGLAAGSDPAMDVPRGMLMDGGTDCDGARGTPRRVEVFFNCNATQQLEAHELADAGESSMCVYWINISLPHRVCFGPFGDEGSPEAGRSWQETASKQYAEQAEKALAGRTSF